ncbi:hypothetical protein, partial [Burkholderia vietnamiensis]|uniref:hypothetical protein n=1 Tax=Burkholderia vietnamiensis TaxID=60552 RepID=UPI001ABBAB1C
ARFVSNSAANRIRNPFKQCPDRRNEALFNSLLVRDSATHPRTLSNRDRALFGLVRLAGDDARHLTWGQGSVLAKLTGDADDAARNLADAYRTARSSAKLDKVTALADAAKVAQAQASSLGAYVQDEYGPGLELLRGGFSTSSIALHDGSVPLRLAGLAGC